MTATTSISTISTTSLTHNTSQTDSQTDNTSQTEQTPLRVAINGFGRIGRNVLRAMLERGDLDKGAIDLVAINDVAAPEMLLHLLKYDSTHKRLSDIGYIATLVEKHSVANHSVPSNLTQTDISNCLHLHLSKVQPKIQPSEVTLASSTSKPSNQTHKVQLLTSTDPTQLPWQDLQVDVVLECTGHFRAYHEANKHCQAGAKQVIIGAAPFDEVDACIVMGVNHQILTRQLPIISSVSCTTQAIVPLIATLDDAFGVNSAMMTEIHAVTADQNVLDQAHRDLRRARASGYNIIPTTSSSIRATERVLPQMTGKINGYSIRVPTIDVAAIDVTFTFNQAVSLEAIKQTLQLASSQHLKGIMGYTDQALVSSDYIHQPESLIIDEWQLMQVGEQYKVFAWYDNEWGYANRLVDMCTTLANCT